MKQTLIKLFYTILLIAIFSHTAKTQILTDSILALYEDSISVQLSSMNRRNSDRKNAAINDTIYSLLNTIVADKNSFTYGFPKLKKVMSIQNSPDGKFKIYNWNISTIENTFTYYAIVQISYNKKKDIALCYLSDSSAIIADPTHETLPHNRWFGALYFDVVASFTKQKKYYTLLGWDGNNIFTNKKIIDVLYFENDTVPMFGAPIFNIDAKHADSIQHRVVFEYSYQSSITLVYNQKIEMIIFDHLSPANPVYKGLSEYYGADFSYDGLEFVNDKWIIREDIDVRNPKPKKK